MIYVTSGTLYHPDYRSIQAAEDSKCHMACRDFSRPFVVGGVTLICLPLITPQASTSRRSIANEAVHIGT